jgi:hypothetical protein
MEPNRRRSFGSWRSRAARVGSIAAAGFFVIFVVWIWVGTIFAPFVAQRRARANEVSAQEVFPASPVVCSSFRDWVVTMTTGPCRDFGPPARVAIGEHFSIAGADHEIRIIVATKAETDLLNGPVPLKAGEWYCEAAENETDLDHEGKQWRRTWLFIQKCQPVR